MKVASSERMQPNAHISIPRPTSGSPRSSEFGFRDSGGAYAAVHLVKRVAESMLPSLNFEIPKSARISLSCWMRILAGLRS